MTPSFRPDTPRVVAGGGLDQPYREMSSSGPDVDRFLPEQLARAYSRAVLGGNSMKISRIVDLHADAGWRVFSFLKIETDAGLIGWSEYNESYGSKGFTVVIMKLAEMLIGRDLARSISSPRTSMRARVRRRAALSSRRSRPSRMRSLT